MNSNTKRIVEMILRGDDVKFKNLLKGEITERAAIILEKLYIKESENVINTANIISNIPQKEIIKETSVSFFPEPQYSLKDGNIGILTTKDRENISKLYKNLNNDNKERMLKLMTESLDSFNRVLRISKG